jgi:hypothetical protein
MRSSESVRARLDKETAPDLNSGCWLWSGGVGAGGYGVVCIDGKVTKAHRWSWYAETGVMPPPEIKVCHKCDVRQCINPAHLFLGTQADNVADMVAKGRHRNVPKPGSLNAGAKLTEQKVWEIRRCVEMDAWTQKEIAKSYGVSPMTVSRIARFEMWPHVHRDWPARAVPHTYGNVWYVG